ncbi:MAG: hypothetical protein ACOY4I_02880 [Bacillota bacterium]
MLLLLSFIFIAIIAIEAPGLVKKRMWRELAAFSVLLLIGMVYSYGQVLDLPLPNPTDYIMAIFKPVSQYLEKILS